MPLPPVPKFKPVANAQAVISAPNVRFTVLTDRIIRLEVGGEHFTFALVALVFLRFIAKIIHGKPAA